jgi:cysteine desulfurase family protein (TIGR01976 family)
MTAALPRTLDLDFVRQQFPALAGDWVFFDNAGGSQTLETVGDRIRDYLLSSNVQLGASYEVSQKSGARVAEGTAAIAAYINAADPSEVVLGSSTSLLLRVLALSLAQTWQPGDEVIVTNSDHEANISPWVDLGDRGIQVKFWTVNSDTLALELDDLKALLSDRTRLVAVTHASNVLGTVNPIGAIADLVHHQGAQICVDGVAYAPHRRIDVQAWDVDFYAFSLYKTYGPHQALLYGKADHWRSLPRFNHYFIDGDNFPYKFQPGNVNFEMTYSLTALRDYIVDIATHHGADRSEFRHQINTAFQLMTDHEAVLGDRLLQFLNHKSSVRIMGQPQMTETRVPTIAFVVNGMDSATVPPQVDPHHIGIRFGDFYAKRLIEDLGLAAQNGVIRVSMVHYNTLEECDRLIQVLDRILPD